MADEAVDSPPEKPIDNPILSQEEQIDIATRLQSKVLRHFEWLLDNGIITSTDLATLTRLMVSNGWRLDPSALPKGLRDKMTSFPDPSADLDEDILPFARKA